MKDSVDQIVSRWNTVRPDLDVSTMAVLGRLSKLARIYEREMAQVYAKHSLQPGEFDILATLRRADTSGTGLTAGELTASSMVTSGAITNRLDRLVAQRLVNRATDPVSRRSIRVSLTPPGKQLIDLVLLDHLDKQQEILADLSPQQRAGVEDLLRFMLSTHESRTAQGHEALGQEI